MMQNRQMITIDHPTRPGKAYTFSVEYTISGWREEPDIKINNIHLCVTENPGCWWERSRLFVEIYDVVERMDKYEWPGLLDEIDTAIRKGERLL